MNETAFETTEGIEERRMEIYRMLCGASAGHPNGDGWARMLASRVAGSGQMPLRLGLDGGQFARLVAHHFPGIDPQALLAGPPGVADPLRKQERDELAALMLAHCPDPDEERTWLAQALANGCMGGGHLWHDLGLWSRKDVSALLEGNFPALKAKNDRDMKWKKFLYKQLCLQEGIYICRSPSCEVCEEYKKCFGPEE